MCVLHPSTPYPATPTIQKVSTLSRILHPPFLRARRGSVDHGGMHLSGGGRDRPVFRPQAQGRRVGKAEVGHRTHPPLALLRLRGSGSLEPREWGGGGRE